jgi:hypothetical protein
MTDDTIKIKILKCSNFILWYRQYIGEEFEVLRDEKTAWWVREKEHPYAINWVYKTDSEVI